MRGEAGGNILTTKASLSSASVKSVCKCLEKWCRETEPKLEVAQCGLCFVRSTTDQFSLSIKLLINLGNIPKMSAHVLSTSRKLSFRTTGSLEKSFWLVLWEYGVDGRLLLTVLSLYFCSDLVSVSYNSQSFTICVGLWHGCVLSSLLFIVCMNWIDSHRRVDKGVVVGSCRINCLLFADDLVLFASSEQGLQHALNRFSAAFGNENQH